MSGFFLGLLLGASIGASVTGLVLNHRYGLKLDEFDFRLLGLISEYERIIARNSEGKTR